MISNLKYKFYITGLTAIALLFGAQAASAQTVSPAQPTSSQSTSIDDIQPIYSSVSDDEVLPPLRTTETLPNAPQEVMAQAQPSADITPDAPLIEPAPASELTATGAAALSESQSLPSESQSLPSNSTEPQTDRAQTNQPSDRENERVAQTVIEPGRSTRSGPSYLAIGGNIGLGGDTSLGDSGFTVFSKIGLTRTISARPAVVIGGNDPTVLVPVTLDFPISSVLETGEVNLEAAPYVGGGIAISTGSGSVVRPLITAGVDVPIADRVTANAGVNFAFFDDTEIGLTLGVGYSF
jgi:hypothetical protein